MNDTSGNRTGSTLDHSLPSRPLSRLVENGITAETGDSTLEKQLTAELVNHETSFKIPASQDTTGSSKRISDTRSEPASLNNNDNNKTSPGSFREASDKKESYPQASRKINSLIKPQLTITVREKVQLMTMMETTET